MSEIIQKIGQIQPLDADGFIINNCDKAEIQAEYMPLLTDFMALLPQKSQMHSLYLRGSIAKGIALKNIADIDAIIIWQEQPPADWQEQENEVERALLAKYNFFTGLDILCMSLAELPQKPSRQFVLRTQSRFFWGAADLIATLPKFRPDAQAKSHSNFLKEDLATARQWLEEEDNPNEIKEICMWAMKRIVRTGFELVMWRAQCFSRDLYPCFDYFSQYYPQFAPQMKEKLLLAIQPSGEKAQILSALLDAETFLLPLLQANTD